MTKTLYLECYSGISGDMTVAALLDLGASQNSLEQALGRLPLEGYKVVISRVKKAGLDVCDFHVILEHKFENHDHDMQYLHGNEQSNVIGDDKETGNEYSDHDHSDHDHSEHSHLKESAQSAHVHRGLAEIFAIIEAAELSAQAEKTAKHIFSIIADAEAKAHGVPSSEVHFHEVGAVDSIVDIVAVAVCLDNLGITEVIVPELYEGRGVVRCQHGLLPIPVPAVSNIVAAYQLPLHLTQTQGELITPTGAAIVAAIQTSDKLPERFIVEKIGMGAGKRTYDRPSILRAVLIRDESVKQDSIYKLETNIDDCSGEALGFVMERLFKAGARDVHYHPVFMKKNRPAYQLNVICSKEDISKLEKIIFEETTTIGIRRSCMERTILERELICVQTSLGQAQMKVCGIGTEKRAYPEYESVVALCKEHQLPYQTVYQLVQKEYQGME